MPWQMQRWYLIRIIDIGMAFPQSSHIDDKGWGRQIAKEGEGMNVACLITHWSEDDANKNEGALQPEI